MKSRVGMEIPKEEEANGTSVPPAYTTVMLPAQQVDHSGATCWYVFGILSTIFCCLPCGVIGLVHAMVAKHEGEKGNLPAHRQRLHQAKCWTSWSIALGLLLVILLITAAALNAHRLGGKDRKGSDEEDMKKSDMSKVSEVPREMVDGATPETHGDRDGDRDGSHHGDSGSFNRPDQRKDRK